MRTLLVLAAALLVLGSGDARAAKRANSLTAAEKKAGWVLLFDGKTTAGWRGFKKDGFPAAGWSVTDGVLRRVPGVDKPGDIVTVDQYESFELMLQWKVTPGGNSGIKYLVDEGMVKPGEGALGFEYQILDDEKHPDAQAGRDGNRTTGGLYDLIPPAKKKLAPAGQWNQTRLLVRGTHVEHWLNGVKTVEYERGSPSLKALIAESKFKSKPGFGDPARGHILLQDHQDEVSFRDLKLRRLTK